MSGRGGEGCAEGAVGAAIGPFYPSLRSAARTGRLRLAALPSLPVASDRGGPPGSRPAFPPGPRFPIMLVAHAARAVPPDGASPATRLGSAAYPHEVSREIFQRRRTGHH